MNCPPPDVEKDCDRALTPRIEQWVRTAATRMVFIYGANDPWSMHGADAELAAVLLTAATVLTGGPEVQEDLFPYEYVS